MGIEMKNPELDASRSWRFRALAVFAVLVTIAMAIPLRDLGILALGSDLHSHILLIPFVTAYLIYLKSAELHRPLASSAVLSGLGLLVGGVFIALAAYRSDGMSETDRIALWTVGYLGLLAAGVFGFLGKSLLRPITFPLVFLIFLIPMPDGMASFLEHWLMTASAAVSEWFFIITGTPVYRDGQYLELPGIALEVARECSGIRSTWVLFVTATIVAYLFFDRFWSRTTLILVIFPLGVLRNAFRILVIGLLCVHVDPEMIHSWIHRKGGPLFFAVSLIPVFVLTWWLRRFEVKGVPAGRRKILPESGGSIL
jgi:exosortase C (VPDSG-CTERM-specific)